ncbi:flagellar motor switch protein FliN [Pseudaeromonas sharmana]|uniref:Flagellar motor switch protein FliN n=1 Tax=Pseudaeromonas sharmana TaxID=328412 RepID=A0ABV8CN34_9GAMM
MTTDSLHDDLMGLDDLDNLFDEEGETAHPDKSASRSAPRDLNFFRHIPVKVTLEVASTELPLGELMHISEGAVIELDKQAGAPLDVRVNGRLLARGEVVVANGKYGLRLVDIIDQQALGQLDL